MTNDNSKQKRQCSVDALKTVYYVVIGLAITEALDRIFIEDKSFIGLKVFEPDNLPSTMLLFAFLFTICRFVHGASIHLGVISDKRYKPLVDFIGFFIQASLFYLMATSLGNPIMFLHVFLVMLFADASWLIFLRCIKYIDFDRTPKQWVYSDFLIIGVFVIIYSKDIAIAQVHSVVCILIVAIVATIFDYIHNKDFYFPPEERET